MHRTMSACERRSGRPWDLLTAAVPPRSGRAAGHGSSGRSAIHATERPSPLTRSAAGQDPLPRRVVGVIAVRAAATAGAPPFPLAGHITSRHQTPQPRAGPHPLTGTQDRQRPHLRESFRWNLTRWTSYPSTPLCAASSPTPAVRVSAARDDVAQVWHPGRWQRAGPGQSAAGQGWPSPGILVRGESGWACSRMKPVGMTGPGRRVPVTR